LADLSCVGLHHGAAQRHLPVAHHHLRTVCMIGEKKVTKSCNAIVEAQRINQPRGLRLSTTELPLRTQRMVVA
jgi:hypothetical protein